MTPRWVLDSRSAVTRGTVQGDQDRDLWYPNDPVSDQEAGAGQGETRFRIIHARTVWPTRIYCSE